MENEKEVAYKILSKGGSQRSDKSGNMVKYKQGEEIMLKPSLAERMLKEDKNLQLQLVEKEVKEKPVKQ